MAIDPYGTLSAWGENLYGQAGTNSITSYSWTQLSNGDQHSLALRSDSTLWAWGLNSSGQLGTNDTINRTSPTQVTGSWSQIRAGFSHTVGIRTNNSVWLWGNNANGQLGQGESISRSSPVQLPIASTGYSIAFPANGNYISGSNAIFNVNALVTTWTVEMWVYPITTGVLFSIGAGSAFSNSIGINWGFTTANKFTLTQGNGSSNVISLSTSGTYPSGIWYYLAVTKDSSGVRRIYVNGVLDTSVTDTTTTFSTGTTFVINGANDNNGLGNSGASVYISNLRVLIGTASYTGSTHTVPTSTSTDITNTKLLTARTTSIVDNSSLALTLTTVGSTAISFKNPFDTGSESYTQVSAGNNFTLAIKTIDKSLWTWGFNTSYQLGSGTTTPRSSPVQVGTSSWTLISAGATHALATDINNKLYGWGNNSSGQIGIKTFSWTQVATGNLFSLAIRSDGMLFAWGLNGEGETGDGSTVSKSSPVQIGASSWSQIAAGNNHALAIRVDGTLWSWGWNVQGQLGLNDAGAATPRSSPVQIGTSTNWSKVAAGNSNSFAINTSFGLYAWGNNTNGVLGVGDTVSRSSPVQVAIPVVSWSQVAAGASFTGGIDFLGRLYTWGFNTQGQLGGAGAGATTGSIISRSSPSQVGASSWSFVAAGFNAMAGITSTGNLFTWGNNSLGELGDNNLVAVVRSSPVQVGTSTWSSITASSMNTAGGGQMLAITTANVLWGWGQNVWGSLGDGTTVAKSSMVAVTGGGTYVSAYAGPASLAITTTTFSLQGWGNNNTYGAVGDNTVIPRSSPVQIGTNSEILITTPFNISGNSWSVVSAGYSHSTALTSDNRLFTWGNNTNGQLGFNRSFISIGAGASMTSIVRSDGTLWTWGLGTSGQLGDNTAVTKSSPVAVGLLTNWSKTTRPSFTNYAIDTTSKLYAWGDNSTGAIGDSTTVNKSSPVQIGNSSWTMVAGSIGGGGVAGQQTTYAIRSDGGLFAWGNNLYNQANSVNSSPSSSPVQIGTSSWSIVSAGLQFAMAITTDGKLYGWGRNDAGQLGITASTFSWTTVNSSGLHTLAIRSDNRLFAWGLNSSGQLGLGDTVPRSSPVQVASGSYTQVSAGLSNSYAIRSDGSLWAWGDNSNGQLGQDIAVTIHRSSPVQLGSTSWSLISASQTQNYVLATRSDNTLYGWGLNTSYQLGNSTTITRSSPVQVSGGGSWTAVSVGGGHALAVKTDYKLYAWGLNNIGQTANNGTSISWSKITATKGSSLNGVFSIRNDGSLWVWGSNQSGQLGLGDTITRSSPVQLGTSSWVSVVAGFGNQTFAIRNDGALFAWGLNNAGQLGDLSAISRSSPVQIGTSSWTVVSAGFSHGAAITTDGKLYTWGGNSFGALGNFTPTAVAGHRSSPVQVGTDSWTSISVGEFHALAIQIGGTLWVWGYNASGQLGINSPVGAHRSQPVQLSTGSWSQVDAKSNGSIGITLGKLFTWGANGTGSLGHNDVIFRSSPVQVGSSSWSLVFSSQRNQVVVHGITISGTLWAWGFNASGNLGDNSTLNRSAPVQIGALTNWTGGGGGFAINNTGQLWGWGYNVDWQLGQGDTVYRSSPVQVGTSTELLLTAPAIIGASSWTSVSAGGSHSTAIRTDGGLFAWGLNNNGQLGLSDTVNRSSPVQVGTSSWVAVSAGGNHTLASRYGDNQLFTWGFNTQGQLGSGVTAARSSPVQVNAYTATTTNALTFNGTSQYLNGPTNTPVLTGGQFTIEAWINLTSFTNNPVMFGNQGWNTGNNIGFIVGITSAGVITMSASAGVFNTFPNIYTGTNIVSTGAWTHIAITRDSSNVIRSFINGVVDPTTATVTQSLYLSNNNTTSLINIGGRIQDGAFQPVGFTGQLSNLRIVPNKAVYTTTFTPPIIALAATQSAGTNIAAITGIPSNGYSVWFNGGQSLNTAGAPRFAAGTGDFTIEFWIFSCGTGRQDWLNILNTGNNYRILIYYTGTTIDYYAGTTSAGTARISYTISTASLNNAWHHIALSRVSGSSRLYYDGNQVGSTFADTLNFSDTNMAFWLGKDPAGSTFMTGHISNARVIIGGTGLYSGTTLTIPTTSLTNVTNTQMLTCQDTTIIDGSTTPLAITNTGTAIVTRAYSPFGTQATILAAQGAAVTSDNSINAYTFTNVATVTQSSVTPFVQLLTGTSSSAGASGSAALGSEGLLNTWGLGTSGQIGDNTIVSKSFPTRVGTATSTIEYSPIQVGSSSWSQVSAGASHTVGIKLDNTVFAWGLNNFGQLGDGTVVSRSSPVQVGTASSTLSNANAYSLSFGAGKYLTTTANSALDIGTVDFTFEVWLYNTNSDWTGANGLGLFGDSQTSIYFNGSSQFQIVQNAATNMNITYTVGALSLNAWHHITIVRISSVVKFYIDGTSVSTSSGQTASLSFSGVKIGATTIIGNFNTWPGFLSNLRLVKGVGVYTGDFTVPATPLTATQSAGTNIAAITSGQTVLLACQNTTATTDNSSIGVTITNTGSVAYSLLTPFVSAVSVGAIFGTQISTGATHSVAIDTSSKLYAWGLNSSGQLGLNDLNSRSAPVQIGLSTNYNNISAGSEHTIALDSVGTLYIWGLGTSGQLGDNTAVTKSSPIFINSMSLPNTSSPTQVGTSSYSFVCTGNNTTAAISSTNKLFVWGLGTTGQLGTSITISRSSPTQISTNSYNLVNAGGTHITFVPNYSPQLILATGLNTSGQLGLSDIISRSSPTQVAASTSSFNSPVTVSTGNYSSYYVSSPTQVGTSSWTSVSAGGTHTLGVRYDNTLWAWGYNANGQLGGSNTINRSSPVQVGTSSWSQVSAGDSHNIILKSDGTINTFGLNTFGQLGDGT